MKRRDFLKAMIAAPAVVAVPALAKPINTRSPLLQGEIGKVAGIEWVPIENIAPLKTPLTTYGQTEIYTQEMLTDKEHEDMLVQMALNAKATMMEIQRDLLLHGKAFMKVNL